MEFSIEQLLSLLSEEDKQSYIKEFKRQYISINNRYPTVYYMINNLNFHDTFEWAQFWVVLRDKYSYTTFNL